MAPNVARDAPSHEAGEEKFRVAVESCPNGMIMSDTEGRIVMVNSEVERLFGYRREELIGASIDILVPERLRRQHLHHRKGFVRTPEKRQMGGHRDLMGRRRDGSEFPVEVGLNPIRTCEGPMVLSAIVDISERVRLERLKDEFVAMVSHELRTPLTSIAGSLGLLMGNAAGHLPDTAVRLLSIAHANSQRLVRLINDILDLQKIEAGQVVFHLKYLDLRPLLEQTLEANRAFANEFDVRIRLDDDAADGEIFADSDRLAQVVTNLLSNAIKFSPKGGEVTVGVERHGDKLRVSVRDRGPGIPDDFKARVFEKFAQADSSNTRQKGGSGLGLSIVRQLIHQHGGEAGFAAAPGGGTIFYFELPNVAAPVRHGAGATPPILLCENDTPTSGLLAEALRRAGLVVEAVSTAAGAQTHAADTPYAALLIDLTLPDLDGISLMRKLRALPSHAATPVIFFALDPEPATPVQLGALSVRDWMPKPADRGQLLRTIHRAIAETGFARPRVLHVEPDGELRALVHEALRAHADIISTGSIESAQCALAEHTYDLAVLDLTLVDDAGIGLLGSIADHDGGALTTLVFSAAPGPEVAERVRSALAGARMSLDRMVGTVRLVLATPRAAADASTEVA
ncbi:MAG TPA: ATP-binding protein [Xanthobacteraceae bacterium]|nr:ATP-binding protein [Xanthobacteraceae bacterium]